MSDSDGEYEVEEIVDSRVVKGTLQYRVKWKGYPSFQNTWEPESHLKHAPLKVAAFQSRTGFDKDFMPEKILCAIDDGNSTKFLIKWLFEEQLEIVSGEMCWANCPELVRDFYYPPKISKK